ncbi:glycoside hydrolase family 15 protein [Sediminicola luteus]|uniref:Glycoside hydrolase n=1 Tax=Sediminicola luteus TaxID=319238 RepID=A0A2A4G3B9_9FLAO|nr:glycoside hydrolase family 15 protein [Sediminicola luteus]PCE62478.1 glycoside hydrolase [Sediminicola luteus]
MENLDYGIVGNCRSAALISKTGSLDWCCLPEFDSPSVFAKLLDADKGGHFGMEPLGEYSVSQKYKEQTAILITRFNCTDGVFELHDFMPRYYKQKGGYHRPPQLIRYIKLISGKPRFKVDYDPKLEYAKGLTQTYVKKDYVVSLTEGESFDSIFLYTSFDKEKVVHGDEIVLRKDGFFLLTYHECIFQPSLEFAHLELERTNVYWLDWSHRTPNFRDFNAQINRSAITLKLLSYGKTGAVLAAATTSLPETIGEVRNWDYRFCWIRDASMVIKVMSELGHKNVAKRYLDFIIGLVPDKGERFQIMYGINGEKQLTEKTLDHLEGYKGSKPVRIGNAAFEQVQNDIYGILMDVILQQLELFNQDIENGEELWDITKNMAWEVERNWQDSDKGIWEFRGGDQHFTFSKLLCWVAIDRAIKVARILGKGNKIEYWVSLRNRIHQDIHRQAWNEEVQAFTQSYGSPYMDASVLLMEPYGFIEAKDPKYVATVKAVERELENDGLLYRYKNEDDFGLPSSSFTICTFWFVNSLFKIGEEARALEIFEQLLGYSNYLGLFSEDIDFKTKRLLGNFPQAYSHLALIECAMNFSKKDREERIRENMGLEEN